MPSYIYKNPETEEYVEVVQSMNDEHVFSKDGVKYQRVFTVPNAAITTRIDPFSQSQFARATDKNGTMGDLFDRSAEMSSKRADLNGGVDPVKEKYFKDYEKKTKGKKHLASLPKTIETPNIKAEF